MNTFWRGVFSEQDGTPSFARIWTAVLATAVISWDSAYIWLAWIWNTRHLAVGQVAMPLLPDPIILAAQAGFFTVLYGANKFTAIFKQDSGGKDVGNS